MSRAPEILDSEMLEIEKVLEVIRDRASNWPGGVDRGHLDNEIATRFAEIGWAVHILWYDTDHENLIVPEITIIGKTRKSGEFDHEQMAHEVTSDILGFGHGGVIKTGKDDLAKIAATQQAHKHSHGAHG